MPQTCQASLEDADAFAVLKDIAAAKGPNESFILLSQVLQLRGWVLQADGQGRLCSLVREQHLMQHVADAASISLRRFLPLQLATYEVLQSFPGYLNHTLDICGLVLSSTTGPSDANGEQLSYQELVRKQVTQTDFLHNLAGASSSIATAITRHLASNSSSSAANTSASYYDGSDSGSRSSASRTGRTGTSSKRIQGKRHKNPHAASGVNFAEMTREAEGAVAADLGCSVLQLWMALQQNWWNNQRNGPSSQATSGAPGRRPVYIDSLTDLLPTIEPVSRLALSILRYHSNPHGRFRSRPERVDQNCSVAVSVTAMMNFILVQLVSESGSNPAAAFCEVITSQHVRDLLLYVLASNTYLLWKKQRGQTKVGLPSPLLSVTSGTVARKQGPRKQQQQQQQQQQLVLGVSDQHMKVLQLIGLAGLPPNSYIAPALNKDGLVPWDDVADSNARKAASNLRKSFIVCRHQQRPRNDLLGLSLYTAVMQLLLQLLLLTPDDNGINSAASCMFGVVLAARPDYAAITDSAEAAAAVRSILAPTILQGVLVMQHALESMTELDAESRIDAEKLCAFLLKQLLIQDPLPAGAYSQIWTSIFSEAPLTAVVALELAVRMIGRCCERSPTLGRCMHQALDAAALHEQLLTASASLAPASAAASLSLGATGLAAQTVSLMASCVKYSKRSVDIRDLELAAAVASAAQKFAAACSMSTSSNKSSNNSASAAPWIHVVARALLACATVLLRSPATATPADSEASSFRNQAAAMSAIAAMQSAGAAVESSQVSPEVYLDDAVSTTAVTEAQDAQTAQAYQCLSEFDSQFESPPRRLPIFLTSLGNPTKGWQCSDLSDILQRLSDAAGWCGKQLQQLHAAVSSNGAALGTSIRELQQQSQQLQESLTAAGQQWEGQVYEQMMQESAGTYVPGSSWMMLLGARQVVGYKLAYQLHQYAVELCAVLPTTFCCNNPSCDNLSGVSELSCVGRRKCSRCQAAGYCSRECQTQHWSKHKTICKVICNNSS